MKIDFGSLIYILIAVAAFAISLLGKNKKKPTRVNSSQNTDVEPTPERKPFLSNLEELLKQEMGIQDQNPIVNNYDDYQEEIEEEKEPEIILEKNKILDTVPIEMLDNNGEAPYSIEYDDNLIQNQSIKDIDAAEEENCENTILNDFDIKKAIVYSEILDRKYF